MASNRFWCDQCQENLPVEERGSGACCKQHDVPSMGDFQEVQAVLPENLKAEWRGQRIAIVSADAKVKWSYGSFIRPRALVQLSTSQQAQVFAKAIKVTGSAYVAEAEMRHALTGSVA